MHDCMYAWSQNIQSFFTNNTWIHINQESGERTLICKRASICKHAHPRLAITRNLVTKHEMKPTRRARVFLRSSSQEFLVSVPPAVRSTLSHIFMHRYMSCHQ